MKKILLACSMSLVAFSVLFARIEERKDLVANVIFTVYELADAKPEIASRLHTPSPERYSESWIHDYIFLEFKAGSTANKMIEKEGFRFLIEAEAPGRLSVRISYQDQEWFRFEHNKPSTVHYIFYGPDSRVYLAEVLFTTANHRIGPIGPGIRR